MRFLKDTHFEFVKFSKTATTVSAIIIVLSLISIFAIRGLNYGIDFSGGTLIQLKFDKETTSTDLRKDLAKVNLDKSVIQKAGGPNEFFIRIAQSEEEIDAQETLEEVLKVSGRKYEILKTEKVGPKIGGELRRDAVRAIIWAIIVIGIYISVRFEFRFAIGAVIALIHDVIFTLGVFSLLQFEISLSTIAAFLTIVGYSLNDTIVLYDRIRENMKKNKRVNIEEQVNSSINQTISRTIITSFTTFIVVLVLAFSNGEVQVFAFAMIIGVLVGTYSSIYIAGPVIIAWENKVKTKK